MSFRIIDVIEWEDQGPNDIMQRVPEVGQGDIRYGSQLIVRPSQVAIFIKEGKALDIFTEGRYTLDPKNINQKFVHLTNFSINKRNTQKFVQNNDKKD